jgi:hypothetical protein
MNDYPDTSFLCGVYRKQDNTTAALAYRSSMIEPLLVSTLLEFEFRQAVRLQVWLHRQDRKKGYTQAEADQMLADWESDIAEGHVEIISTDADAVLRMAEHLSKSTLPSLATARWTSSTSRPRSICRSGISSRSMHGRRSSPRRLD